MQARWRAFARRIISRDRTRNPAVVQALCGMLAIARAETFQHVERVVTYATLLGQMMGCSEHEQESLRLGALLHDVGKLAVPESILNKPGRLTPDEFTIIKTHATIGAQVLEGIDFQTGSFAVLAPVRWHHENFDGGGYPDGLSGEQIPRTARIVAVVDSFDAVREDRPYRKGSSREEAISIIKCGSGTRFDPMIARLFVANLDRFERHITVHMASKQPPPPSLPHPVTISTHGLVLP